MQLLFRVPRPRSGDAAIRRIYQQTCIDTYAKAAVAKRYDRKNALVAADMLNETTFRAAQFDLDERLPPFCGNSRACCHLPGAALTYEAPWPVQPVSLLAVCFPYVLV